MQPLAPEDRAHTGNRLLDALPQPALERLRPHLEPVPRPSRQVLSKPGEPIDHAYFVQQGMVSLVTPLSDGAVIEIGLIGAEGFVGGAVLLGAADGPRLRNLDSCDAGRIRAVASVMVGASRDGACAADRADLLGLAATALPPGRAATAGRLGQRVLRCDC